MSVSDLEEVTAEAVISDKRNVPSILAQTNFVGFGLANDMLVGILKCRVQNIYTLTEKKYIHIS